MLIQVASSLGCSWGISSGPSKASVDYPLPWGSRGEAQKGMGKGGFQLRLIVTLKGREPAFNPFTASAVSGRTSPLLLSKGGVERRSKGGYLVDPASSHMLVSKIKPCMSKYKLLIL